jgi:putative hydrolase of the HAD superfamily
VLEDSIPIDHLVLSPDVAHLLRRLRNNFNLLLLTSGSTAFQNAKIDQLGIRSYFKDVVIVPSGSHLLKARALASLASKHTLDHEGMLVVGNRLDQEIAAANSLGMPSVWIKYGEGCEMVPISGRTDPDFTIENVLRLPALLWD